MPAHPQGKPAGVPCGHLDRQRRCTLFGLPQRPAVCRSLAPSQEMCGHQTEHAMQWLRSLEDATRPSTQTTTSSSWGPCNSERKAR